MCHPTAFWIAICSGEKPTVYFIEDGLKGIGEGAWLQKQALYFLDAMKDEICSTPHSLS
jgi:hypothetical protein